MHTEETPRIASEIPPPSQIRFRLAEVSQEKDALQRLLKLSVRLYEKHQSLEKAREAASHA